MLKVVEWKWRDEKQVLQGGSIVMSLCRLRLKRSDERHFEGHGWVKVQWLKGKEELSVIGNVGGLGEYPVCHSKFSLCLFRCLYHVRSSHCWTNLDDLYVMWLSSMRLWTVDMPSRIGGQIPHPQKTRHECAFLWNMKACILSKLLHGF